MNSASHFRPKIRLQLSNRYYKPRLDLECLKRPNNAKWGRGLKIDMLHSRGPQIKLRLIFFKSSQILFMGCVKVFHGHFASNMISLGSFLVEQKFFFANSDF